LQLFLQLDLDGLPEELGGRFGIGLLQLFYCTRGECQGSGGWEPFADDLSRVRVVQPTGPGLMGPVPEQEHPFPPKRIVGWQRFIDLPHADEHEELGVTYTYDSKGRTVKVECPALGVAFENAPSDRLDEQIGNSKPGDKLGGWPAWVQSVEYPFCPRCGKRMAHVFQVDSENNVPFMFGDVGCGHITQCPEHKDFVAFGWACC
jgi:hypothetical protein